MHTNLRYDIDMHNDTAFKNKERFYFDNIILMKVTNQTRVLLSCVCVDSYM